MIIVLTGVSGSGKTTIGTRLAAALHCRYLEGDLFHPPENIEKMHRGIPLDDLDRKPWLAAIHAVLVEAQHRGETVVVGCSALKESYRKVLSEGVSITWVYLRGSPELLRARLRRRKGHFLKADMLDSQLETLEEPRDAIVADVSLPKRAIVAQILQQLTTAPEVIVSPSLRDSSLRAADWITAFIAETVARKGRLSLALSGGSTPHTLYQLLTSVERYAIPWPAVHIFWCDERYVSVDDALSNYGMAKTALLDHVPCPASNVHPMPTGLADPRDAARMYEKVVRDYFDQGQAGFDLTLLGLGEDGHTASLFPGSDALLEEKSWVLPVTAPAPAEPRSRLTLTLPLLTKSACTAFLVSGAEKAAAVRDVLQGDGRAPYSPAHRILRSPGKVVWWLDREAAAALEPSASAPEAG